MRKAAYASNAVLLLLFLLMPLCLRFAPSFSEALLPAGNWGKWVIAPAALISGVLAPILTTSLLWQRRGLEGGKLLIKWAAFGANIVMLLIMLCWMLAGFVNTHAWADDEWVAWILLFMSIVFFSLAAILNTVALAWICRPVPSGDPAP